MELQCPHNPEQQKLLPVVRYSVERRIQGGRPDFWDWATLLELAVLAREKEQATDALGQALASTQEPWELETTARNLRLIRESRKQRGDNVPWAQDIEMALLHQKDTE